MITEKIKIEKDGKGAESALAVTEKAAAYGGLDHKEGIRLTLLAEELIGLFRSIAGDTSGSDFWIEEKDREYKVHMKADVMMDKEMREEFLSISRSGKNAAAVGFMGKLKDLISAALLPDPEAMPIQNSVPAGFVPIGSPDSSGMAASLIWTLKEYREDQEKDVPNDTEEWDGLEKSIVANIADDVVVSVSGSVVDVCIIKRF